MDRNTTTYDDLPDMEDSFAVERWAWGALYGELRYEIKELAIHLQKLKEVSARCAVEATLDMSEYQNINIGGCAVFRIIIIATPIRRKLLKKKSIMQTVPRYVFLATMPSASFND